MRKNSSNISFFQKKLLKWFAKNGRDYPWRKEQNSYKILIAEVMLQRTKVEQVLPVYKSFIKKFPNVKILAKTNTEEIAEFVSKLGLFWRSKLMLAMAKTVVNDYDSKIPNKREELLKIPGIGDYIADAMISFAFGGKRTIIDSNVIRLVSRFYGIEVKGEMRRKKSFVEFCQKLSYNLVPEHIKQLNWAMLDHSAIVCKPEPLCVKCPLSLGCDYFNERGLIVMKS